MRKHQLFHRWVRRQPEGSHAGRLWQLCQSLNLDLCDLGSLTDLTTFMDYEAEIMGVLSSQWLWIETFSGPGEKEVRDAREAAKKTLVPPDEAEKLLRSAWRTWLLHFQTPKEQT